ncbi:hypothetical protein D0T56_12355 [Dysgonomonas sp. 520]|nr:hypothetical protein [Dysgonomonas sp. 520]
MIAKIKDNQSLIDLAIQTGGSIEAVFDLAIKNNLSITESLVVGTTIATAAVVASQIVNYYATRRLTPATDITDGVTGGIGAMGIEIDFVVN